MFFAAPWWLLGLPLWLAAVLWLLWGRRRRVNVPFLELWKGPVEPPAPRKGLQPPPAWLAAALAGTLFALLGAAGPALRRPAADRPPLTVIVDRGITMSARGTHKPRFRELAAAVAPAIADIWGRAPVRVLTVPGGQARESDSARWPQLLENLAPTAADTRDELRLAIVSQRMSRPEPVIVISDQDVGADEPAVVRIAPAMPVHNAGIVHIAARARPSPQVMVRIVNSSNRSARAPLVLRADGREVAQIAIDLPAAGAIDRFMDLPAPGRVLTARLEIDDDLPADNEASLVYERSWPVIEARCPLPPAMQRMVEAYRRLRPAGEGSRRVIIVDDLDMLPLNEPAALISRQGAGIEHAAAPPGGDVRCVDHPVTRNVSRWPAPASRSSAAAAPAWTTLVRHGEAVLLAVREQPARAAWTCLESDRWAATPDFVVFWTNLFNWLGEGAEDYRAYATGPLGAEWSPLEGAVAGADNGLWPGIYRRSDGVMRAVNAPQVPFGPTGDDAWQRALRRLAQSDGSRRADLPLRTAAVLAALGCLLASAILWRPAVRQGAGVSVAQVQEQSAVGSGT